MNRIEGKTAVITGAGTGIGRALAIKIARLKASVILLDINQEALEETAALIKKSGGAASTALLDVSDRKQVTAFADRIAAPVHILINNAGVALSNVTVANMTYEDMDWVLGVNLHGVINCTKAFLPHIMNHREGAIVNVSSVYGLTAVAKASAYCTSKFAVRGFTESLRQELRGSGITVTVVHPGGVKSNIARNTRRAANGDPIKNPAQAVHRFEESAHTSPEQAADEIIGAMLAGKPRLVIGRDARFLDYLGRLNPAGYDSFMLKHVVKPAEESK